MGWGKRIQLWFGVLDRGTHVESNSPQRLDGRMVSMELRSVSLHVYYLHVLAFWSCDKGPRQFRDAYTQRRIYLDGVLINKTIPSSIV